MKLLSWNINGLRARLKDDKFESMIEDSDIICLQEVKLQNDSKYNFSKLHKTHPYQFFNLSTVKKSHAGVAILSRILPIKKIETDDKEGRILLLEYPKFYLFNLYITNAGSELQNLKQKHQFMVDLQKIIYSLNQNKQIVLCGDFNAINLDIDVHDIKNHRLIAGCTVQEQNDLIEFLKNNNFVNVYRHFNPTEIIYTYFDKRSRAFQRKKGYFIDYFIVSNTLLNKIQNIQIKYESYGPSDHCILECIIDF